MDGCGRFAPAAIHQNNIARLLMADFIDLEYRLW
jgi:hypothetical protein